MVKVRVYELAKELKVNSKEVINKLKELDISVKNHMSSVSEEEAQKLKKIMNPTAVQKDNLAKDRDKKQKDESSSKKSEKNRGNKEEKAPEPKVIEIEGPVTVQELAEALNKNSAEIIKKLMNLGVMATINQEINIEEANLVASEFGYDLKQKEIKEEELLPDEVDDPASLKERPAVVTVMGHVDHGKTSLLDAIRSARVTAKEAGGITQHIGAYQVKANDKKITFIDTPGHEAFTAMRARGAQATDIAILVVAADDGVMPQTIEAINHAKAAEVPIIVAINKMDKQGANPDRVKQELTEHGLVAEEWGGDTICVQVSAISHHGIDDLLEMILLVAEVEELQANPDRKAAGIVVEAKLDKGRGPVSTVIVQKGTLKIGDIIVAGFAYGKVRAMMDHAGKRVKNAEPSYPVEVLGLSDVPEAGEPFAVVNEEKEARNIVEKKITIKKEEIQKRKSNVSLDELFKQAGEGKIKDLNIIIKGDVQGSVEALSQSLEKLATDEVKVNIIHNGVGNITETDVMLATASSAIIIGFNVRPDANTRKAAEKENIDIRLYRVIYDAIEDVKNAMAGLLDPDIQEVVQGRAEVRATFKVPKIGTIAGSYVTEGKITNTSKLRVIRDGVVIHEAGVASLKRFKEDAKEVAQGYECGIGVENYNDLKEGDEIEAHTYKEIKREL